MSKSNYTIRQKASHYSSQNKFSKYRLSDRNNQFHVSYQSIVE